MFAKLTPASLCVCNNPSADRVLFELKKQSKTIEEENKTKANMIDTQIQRETMPTMIGGALPIETKMAANNRDNREQKLEVSRVNDLNARNKRGQTNREIQTQVPQDINCNTTDKVKIKEHNLTTILPQQQQQQQHQQQQHNYQPLNRVMSVPNGKRSPKSLDVRKEEVMAIRNRFPTKVPIIVQRFCKETALPQLDKSKYLVPQEITMSQFLTIIRNRMRITSTQTLYLLVNNRSMISLSLTLAEVYNEYAGTDGFLYVTYASQEVFGGSPNRKPQTPTSKLENPTIPTLPTTNYYQPQAITDLDLEIISVCDNNSSKLPNFTIQMTTTNATESHFDAFLDNTYKSMCFG